jgi:hypothetical protein
MLKNLFTAVFSIAMAAIIFGAGAAQTFSQESDQLIGTWVGEAKKEDGSALKIEINFESVEKTERTRESAFDTYFYSGDITVDGEDNCAFSKARLYTPSRTNRYFQPLKDGGCQNGLAVRYTKIYDDRIEAILVTNGFRGRVIFKKQE